MFTQLGPNQPSRDTEEDRLILDQADFLAVAPRLLIEFHLMAVGHVRRRIAGRIREFIVDRWEFADGTPRGLDRPPLLDWAVLASSPSENRSSVGNHLQWLIEELQPKRSQLVVALLLDPTDHARLTTGLWHDGCWTFPQETHLIGPGMLILQRHSDKNSTVVFSFENPAPTPSILPSASAAPNDLRLRESRTAGALRSLYDRLGSTSGRMTHAVVVGAGGGGQELVRQLIACGVRHVTTIDGDTIGPENLDRMTMAHPADIGQPKVRQLARAVYSQQPELLVHAIPKSVQHSETIKYLHRTRADVLFSFLDSDVGRLATSLLAREMHAVHIDVGSLIQYAGDPGAERRVMSADVRLFVPGGRGCVACVPEMPGIETVLYHLSSPANCLERGQPRPWNTNRAGSLLHLNSLAAGLAMETWFAWLERRIFSSTWTRLRWDGLVPQVESIAVNKGDNCLFCNERPQ